MGPSTPISPASHSSITSSAPHPHMFQYPYTQPPMPYSFPFPMPPPNPHYGYPTGYPPFFGHGPSHSSPSPSHHRCGNSSPHGSRHQSGDGRSSPPIPGGSVEEFCRKYNLQESTCDSLNEMGFEIGDGLSALKESQWERAAIPPLTVNQIIKAYGKYKKYLLDGN
jgi:hypothetical protein